MYRREIQERRERGLGYHRDSTVIDKLPSTPAIFDGITGLRVLRSGSPLRFAITTPGGCPLAVFVDRMRLDFFELYLLAPQDIAAVETYNNSTFTPVQFRVRNNCGAIVVWTKRFFK
ncbi:MAG TPA: hypothetical protein VEB19_02025 [Gemmatimonadaceae bacterium]|nr:hypothetical protein [Gemmatimonadaceae bacterium]